ncbi:MAG: helix-turn-helix transcriptional regulator [Candidatus Tyrphobacter sp.]
MRHRTEAAARSAQRSSLAARIAASWDAGRFREAAATYDREAGKRPPPHAALFRARAYLKEDDAPAAIKLLDGIATSDPAIAARRDLFLASAHALVGHYDVADELFGAAYAAARLSSDRELANDVVYYRAQRYLFERRPDAARALLPEARTLHTVFAELRTLHLESFILDQEGMHHDQARVLMHVLSRIDPNSLAFVEIRAWATNTLATLARELYLPEALSEIERQLGGTQWPDDFDDRRFQTLKALGWACALRGDYFNAFRFLRLCSRKATSDAWRTVAAAERAELARCNGEPLWSRQELAEAEEYAAAVDWNAVRDEARVVLLLLAELFVPIDAAKASYYQARFNDAGAIAERNHHLTSDPRLGALAGYSAAIVNLATDHRKIAIDLLKKALATFGSHAYDWRAGRCALRLYEATREIAYLDAARELLRHYAHSWLGDELRKLAERPVALPPMQARVLEQLRKGLSTAEIATVLGRSEFTIRNHIKLIFKAFQVNSRAALIAKLSGSR